MLCQECKKKQAIVHLTEIFENQATEFHLCEECAQKKEGFSMFTPLSINDILSSFLNTEKHAQSTEKKVVLKCGKCGINYNDFKSTGRLGCGNCYKSFRIQLLPLIRRVQGGTLHSGKISKSIAGNLRIQKRITQLKLKLNKLIANEEYEKAAIVRDEIRKTELQIHTD